VLLDVGHPLDVVAVGIVPAADQVLLCSHTPLADVRIFLGLLLAQQCDVGHDMLEFVQETLGLDESSKFVRDALARLEAEELDDLLVKVLVDQVVRERDKALASLVALLLVLDLVVELLIVEVTLSSQDLLDGYVCSGFGLRQNLGWLNSCAQDLNQQVLVLLAAQLRFLAQLEEVKLRLHGLTFQLGLRWCRALITADNCV